MCPESIRFNPDYSKLFGSEMCHNSGPPFYSVIPPFTDLSPAIVLSSKIFNNFRK